MLFKMLHRYRPSHCSSTRPAKCREKRFMGKGDYHASNVNSRSWDYLAYVHGVADAPLPEDQFAVAQVPL